MIARGRWPVAGPLAGAACGWVFAECPRRGCGGVLVVEGSKVPLAPAMSEAHELGEMAGLVCLDVDLELVQEAPPWPRCRGGDAGAVGRRAPRQVLPSTAMSLNRRGPAFRLLGGGAGPGSLARWPWAACAWRPPAWRGLAEGRVRATGSAVQHHPDRVLIRCPVLACDRFPGARTPGSLSCWLVWGPHARSRVRRRSGGGERATATRRSADSA